jgi:hypothetical protein
MDICVRCGLVLLLAFNTAAVAAGWSQWGAGPTHESSSTALGQPLEYTLSDIIYDPLAPQEQAADGDDLLVHYQAPIVDGNDVIMTYKSGTISVYGDWNSQVWSVKRLSWSPAHQLGEIWSFVSDWKPASSTVAAWEPVFHPALDAQTIYAPGLGGSLLRIRRSDGFDLGRVKPFGDTLDPDTFVAGPLTVDGEGNVYYNAIKFDASSPYNNDVAGAWLVRVTPDGNSSTVTFATLVADAPAAGDLCEISFFSDRPWPPSADALAPSGLCGSQRPGLNVAPAVAPDGTIYTVSRAHHNDRYAYLIAVNANLTPKWHASMRNLFNDGCNVLLPPNGASGGCRSGSNTGVDPATNNAGSARVLDEASSSPTIAPDGSILYGAYTQYNYASGHLTRWSATGDYLGSYPFGWDQTPSIYLHDGTYSIIVKENHYDEGSYCSGDALICGIPRGAADPEQYLISQVDPALNVEWKFKSTNTESCNRQPDGSVQCVSDHPNGFEWCINAPAVDANGTVFVNSEDGGLYAIGQGGTANRSPLSATGDRSSLHAALHRP